MKLDKRLVGATIAALIVVGAGQIAFAHDQSSSAQHRHGQQGSSQSAMTGGGHGSGAAMMGGQQMMPGMMRRSGAGMMDRGMMHGMMSMMPGSARGVMRVRPTVHLSIDDVRHHFEHLLQRRANPRLRVGSVEMKDDDVVVAQIETVDGSLVEAFNVDRHSGVVSPAGSSQ